MLHAKALLLINDGNAQIFVGDVLGNQAVSANDDIYGSIFESFESFFHFTGFSESVEKFDAKWVVTHALAKCAPVLLGEYRSGNKDGCLFASRYRLENGTNGHFCFTKSNVPTNQPVHRFVRLHVCFGIINGVSLACG